MGSRKNGQSGEFYIPRGQVDGDISHLKGEAVEAIVDPGQDDSTS